ncbi:hypothetical protein NSB1T_03325 [Coprobacter fastidiosus NSB1 = JCM 33896]|nr:hypothetical protein NSB1T_03325 [Coprobacter fastidiosus NSB1 = JCM 33896]
MQDLNKWVLNGSEENSYFLSEPDLFLNYARFVRL